LVEYYGSHSPINSLNQKQLMPLDRFRKWAIVEALGFEPKASHTPFISKYVHGVLLCLFSEKTDIKSIFFSIMSIVFTFLHPNCTR